jgi:hypothetical protein
MYCDYDYDGEDWGDHGCDKVVMTHRWYELSEKTPEDNRDIIVMDSSGQERHLKFYKNMFWLPDLSMYVYYTPSRWRYA